MEDLMDRLKVRLPEVQLTDAQLRELLQTVSDRLCLRLGVGTLPSLFGSVCVDATVKMVRRIYYEGVSSEGAANITTSFVDDVLAEYAGEIEDYRNLQAASGNNQKVVYFY